jgi:hypothetical protein
MAAPFCMADSGIRWFGVDDDTPPEHCTAIGTDRLGNKWLWLFKGDAPSDDGFVGAVQIPDRAGQAPSAYGRNGGWAGLATDTKAVLAQLAAKAAA